MGGQPGFFDLDERLAALAAKGDPLTKLAGLVDFELFRPTLEAALPRSDRSKGGRPPYDQVLMLKLLVLQALYGLADEQAEFQVKDRLSFMRFLGLGLRDPVPDATTLWLFREQLTRAGAIEALFARFDAALREAGYLAMAGQIIDASIVEAPRQRMTEDEKAAVKAGRVPEAWRATPAKLAQKDRDARWTLKRGRRRRRRGEPDRHACEVVVPAFGYKNHVSTDRRHGLIRRWAVGDAAEHDTRRFRELLDTTNTAGTVWADTAYRSAKNERHLERRGFASKIHFRTPPGRPLPAARARANAARGKVRARIEHVFAAQKRRMGLFIRTIGLVRARTKIGLANLAYNLNRFVWLEGRAAPG